MHLKTLTFAAVAALVPTIAHAQATFSDVASFQAAVGPTVLEDFNDELAPFFIAPGETLNLSSFDVRIPDGDGSAGDAGVNVGTAARNTDGTNFLELVLTTDDDIFPGTIFFDFETPITALAFEVADVGPTPNSEIVLLDTMGNLLGNADTTLNADGEGFFGVEFASPQSTIEIDLVALNPLGTFDFTGFDNVRFAVVPEPASLSLLSLGALALRRRR